MATADEIAAFRLLIAESVNREPYTDTALSERLDAASDVNTLAYEIWTEKAAARADLADISEGGSSRKQGDLYEQNLKMAQFFRNKVVLDPPIAGGFTRIAKIRRP